MKENGFKKGLVYAIVVLFIGISIIPLTGSKIVEKSSLPIEESAPSFDGNILYVGGSGSGNYTKIQDAIDAANPGDTIFVYSGTYHEVLIIDKSINLLGENKITTIIDGGGNGDIVNIATDDVNINGFTVRNGDKGISIGSYDYYISSNCNISNCDIYDTSCGIYTYLWSSYNDIFNCDIHNTDYGIHLDYSPRDIYGDGVIDFMDVLDWVLGCRPCYNDILNCDIYNNSYGIYLNNCETDFRVDNGNTVMGIMTLSQNLLFENSISNCDIYSNSNGISLLLSSGNTITGNTIVLNSGCGVSLGSTGNNIITGNNISNNDGGINLHEAVIMVWVQEWPLVAPLGPSSNNIITDNTILNNNNGIRLDNSGDNTISNNTFFNDGLSVCYSLSVHRLYQNTVSNNTVNNKPLVYLEEESDTVIDDINDAGQVMLINCDNVTIQNQDLSNTDVGIELWDTDNCLILGNNISNNGDGINLYYSGSNSITGNNITSNDDAGIYLWYSISNSIIGNNISNNDDSIYLGWDSNENTISGNTIISNNRGGIYLYHGSSNNLVYLNNFINNNPNVYFSGRINHIWKSPEQITYAYNNSTYTNYLGNYYDDYTGSDGDGDGIGDASYRIKSCDAEAYIVDDYPLMTLTKSYKPGMITSVTIKASDPLDTEPGFGWENVSCAVIDTGGVGVKDVKLVVTNPNATTVEYPMANIPETDIYYYNTTFTQPGNYTYHIWANDTSDNEATSSPQPFNLPMNEDVDMNGQVYFDDFIAILVRYGETGPPGWIREDVNNDGVLYFDDFIRVAMHYGEEW